MAWMTQIWQKYYDQYHNHHGFRKYLSNISWMFICKLCSTIVSLIASISIARYLTPEGYGLFSTILSFVAVFNISLFVTNSLLVKKLNAEPEKRNEILGSALVIKIVNNLIAFLIVLLASLISAKSNFTLFLIILYTSGNIWGVFSFIDQQFQADAKNKPVAIMNAIWEIIFALARIVIVLLGLDIAFIIASFALFSLMTSIRYIILYQRHYHNILSWRVNKDIVKFLCWNSIPFSIAAFTGTVGGEIDKLILKTFTTTENVGFYTVATTLSNGWGIILGTISTALLPAVLNSSRNNYQVFLSRLKKYYSLLFYLSLLIAFFTYLTATPAITILYGEAYLASISLLQTVVWSIIFSYIGLILYQHLLSQNQFKLMMLYSMVGAISSVIINVVLVNYFGVIGAAYTRIICSILPVMVLLALPAMKDQRKIIWQAIIQPLKN